MGRHLRHLPQLRHLVPAGWVDVTRFGAFLDGTGLYLPGTSGNYASIPDSAATSITGDIDIRARVALTNWASGTAQYVVSKWNGTQSTFAFGANAVGGLILVNSTTGSNSVTRDSTANTGLAGGGTSWIRVTLDVDNGAAGNTARFYTSSDGSAWTQLGADVVTAGVTSLFDSTTGITVGGINAGITQPPAGTIYRAQVLSGIAGTTQFDADFAAQPRAVTSFTESSANAATVTINRSV